MPPSILRDDGVMGNITKFAESQGVPNAMTRLLTDLGWSTAGWANAQSIAPHVMEDNLRKAKEMISKSYHLLFIVEVSIHSSRCSSSHRYSNFLISSRAIAMAYGARIPHIDAHKIFIAATSTNGLFERHEFYFQRWEESLRLAYYLTGLDPNTVRPSDIIMRNSHSGASLNHGYAEGDRKKIEDLNFADMDLYQHALNVFNERIEILGEV